MKIIYHDKKPEYIEESQLYVMILNLMVKEGYKKNRRIAMQMTNIMFGDEKEVSFEELKAEIFKELKKRCEKVERG